ncbi:MAG: MFS transporter [Actinomycetota bacterium]|nr:MFS transporter [Actinomycetota bacterium]
MLHRALDQSYSTEVRHRLTLLVAARTAANACFRFAPPFLATIASGLGVPLERMGIALAISELSGLFSTFTGSVGERMHRRTAMATGLAGTAIATGGAAASPNMWVFCAALVLLAQSKVLFDLGLGAWVSDRVPYAQRGRVMGLTETSWALGLLLGVTAMGLVTAATNWRVGYALGATAVLAMAGLVARTVGADPAAHEHHARTAPTGAKVAPRSWRLVVGAFCLMGSTQMLFVTFGSWLKDHYGMTAAGVSAVVFGLGFCELFSSLSAARFTDHWGKARSAAIGAGVMMPAALILSVVHGHLWIALPMLVIAIAAFEFAIVSTIPLGSELVRDNPARGIAILFTAGTLGRAAMSIPATRLYERHGMAWPALGCAALAGLAVVAVLSYGDTAHGDTAHGDTAHGDTAHGDTAHGDTVHGDTVHGDVVHGDVVHGDAVLGDN